MFIKNKYTRLYYQIINNAIALNRSKRRSTHHAYVYYETHHIIPKCMNGNDSIANLVLLTAREHFLCHYLLPKMVTTSSSEWHKLVRAFTYMYSSSAKQTRYINSRLYESARKNIGIVMSQCQTGKGNSQFGTTWVSNITNKHCCKITIDQLQEYIDNGYLHRRIISWANLARTQQQEHDKKIATLKSKIRKLDNHILELSSQKFALAEELALLERVELS